jgi:hypothetical protein
MQETFYSLSALYGHLPAAERGRQGEADDLRQRVPIRIDPADEHRAS